MIDSKRLLADLQKLLKVLEADIAARLQSQPDKLAQLNAEWQAARDANRTAATRFDWQAELVTQAAVHWILANVNSPWAEMFMPAPGGPKEVYERYEQDNNKIVYSGKWLDFIASGASGGSYKYADSTASVTITFSGTRLDWIATKGYTQGKALVSLDGGPGVKVNLYNSITERQVKVWSTGVLAAGTHTVTIRWTGEAGAAGGGTRVNLDAVDVAGSLQ